MNKVVESVPVVRVQIVKDRDLVYNTDSITNKYIAAKVIGDLLKNYDRECFVSISLDVKKKIQNITIVSIGIVDQSLVHPREVFKTAILSNACSIIVGHNHPSGNTEPSPEDLRTTKRLQDCGELLGIPVVDHIIVGDNNKFISLKAKGYMSNV